MKIEGSKLKYEWIIFALLFLMIFFSLGFCSSNRTIFLAPVTEALGIKRSVFAVSDSFRFVSASITNFFFGALVNRFGTKRLIISGLIFITSALVLFAAAENVLWFYLGGTLLGIGFSWTSTSMVGYVITRWSKNHIGTLTGFILSANGIGGAVATQLYMPLINEKGNPFGYRKAYCITAFIIVGLIILFSLLYKENPRNSIENISQEPNKEAEWEGIDLSKAKKMPYFYFVIISVFLLSATLEGVYSVVGAYLKDVGFNVSFRAVMVSILLFSLAASKVLSGAIYDKFGLRVNLSVCGILAMVALIAFMFLNNSFIGYALVILSVIAFAMALPLQTVMLPIIARELFGLKSYKYILGILVSAAYAGYGVGVLLINCVYDIFGSYIPGFFIACFLMLFVTVVFQIAINCSNKYKKGEIV